MVRCIVLVVVLSLALASIASAFQPFAVDSPTRIFVNVTHPTPPTSRYYTAAILQHNDGAVPTNAWWMNAVIYNNSNPIMPLPYQIIMKEQSVAVGSTRKQAFADYVATWWVDGFNFASSAALAPYKVTAFDRLSVTFTYAQSSGSGSMVVPITRGSPYITAKYIGIPPFLNTIAAIVSVNQENIWGEVTATKLKCTLNSGQVWIIYTDHNATWSWNVSSIWSASSFSEGWIVRVAHLHNDFDNKNVTLDEMEYVLDTYSSAYATGGNVVYTMDYDTNTVNTTINWIKEGAGDLLTMALPHQQAMNIKEISAQLPLRFDTIKGTMVPVIGSTWHMATTLLPSSFTAPRPLATRIAQSVINSLFVDSEMQIPINVDPYTFGKTAAKLARLILIADEIGQSSLASRLRQRLSAALIPWFTSNTSDPLQYDQSWGGLCSRTGLANAYADFGNGYYSDHHFHYGYFAYSIAALVKSPDYHSFVQTYRTAILAIVRDYANPSNEDPYFPVMRHVDAFEGHSWADGIFGDFGDNRNQESSSEAINAYYGVMLLGKALGDVNMEAAGRTFYTLEVLAVNMYWHMTSTKSVYPQIFSENKCVGIVWSSKVVEGTWFASGPMYTHAINMLPFTPASEFYMTKDWISEEYPYLAENYIKSSPPPTDAWKGFMYGSEAVIDPVGAEAHLNALKEWDNGNSLTNMLYWVGTRPNMPDLKGHSGTGAQPEYYY